MNLKSEIAPKGIKFDIKEFVISGKNATILTVISYPKSIAPGFLANLTNLSGVKIVAKHIPIEFSVLQNMLNKEIADLDRIMNLWNNLFKCWLLRKQEFMTSNCML